MAKRKFQPGIYKHYKGNLYYALTKGKSSEDVTQEFVVYIPLYRRKVTDPPAWIRPLPMFMEDVRIGKDLVPRFKLVEAISLFEAIEKMAKTLSKDETRKKAAK